MFGCPKHVSQHGLRHGLKHREIRTCSYYMLMCAMLLSATICGHAMHASSDAVKSWKHEGTVYVFQNRGLFKTADLELMQRSVRLVIATVYGEGTKDTFLVPDNLSRDFYLTSTFGPPTLLYNSGCSKK